MEKTKQNQFYFNSVCNFKKVRELDIRYKDIKIRQYKHVNYLGCMLDKSILGETMALRVIEKFNTWLKFLYQKNPILDVPLRRLLCNALIQPQFDYACTVWYLNLSKKN